VSPNYLQISTDLQVMLSNIFANTQPASKALASEAPTVKTDATATPGG
jgi:hypothetical protein